MNNRGSSGTAHIMRHPDLSVIDLAFSRIVPELLGDFIYLFNTGRANRVTAGLKPTTCVDRDLPAECCLPVGGKFSRFSFPAESQVFNST